MCAGVFLTTTSAKFKLVHPTCQNFSQQKHQWLTSPSHFAPFEAWLNSKFDKFWTTSLRTYSPGCSAKPSHVAWEEKALKLWKLVFASTKETETKAVRSEKNSSAETYQSRIYVGFIAYLCWIAYCFVILLLPQLPRWHFASTQAP